jgi:hypothetical protein
VGGKPHICGLHSLKRSIDFILALYGEEFDYVICHNNLTNEHFEYIKSLGITLFEQNHCQEMEYVPKGVAWKLYPPRLREDAHEMFIDNDIVIHSRSGVVDVF